MAGDPEPHGLGRRYGFATVGPIFADGKELLANAAFPADLPFGSFDVTSQEDTNTIWRLDAKTPKGFVKVPPVGLAPAATAPGEGGSLTVLGSDKSGFAIFRGTKAGFVRLADYPALAQTGSFQSFAAKAGAGALAAVLTFPPNGSDETRLVYTTDLSHWRLLTLPVPQRRVVLSLSKEKN